MTKGKVFMSTVGVLAAAAAVFAGYLVKKRGKVEIEGEVKANGGPLRPGKGIRGSATIGANKVPGA